MQYILKYSGDRFMYYALKGRSEYRGYPLLLFSTEQGGGSDQPHTHDFIEIALVSRGYATHCVYGKDDIILRETLMRGDLFIIPPGISHQFQNKQHVKLYTMAFLPELLTAEEMEILKTLPVFSKLGSHVWQETPRIHLLPLEFAKMESLLQKVMSELSQPRDQSLHYLLAKSLVIEYLIAIGTHDVERWSRAPEDADRMILQAINEMERHPEKKWQLADLARRYGMCASGFGRKFREVTGIPPLKYCRLLRLEQVREELLTSSIPVEVLAEKYGFTDSNHLIKLFKKRYGMTPLAFRKTI